jgi:hypothetical protein
MTNIDENGPKTQKNAKNRLKIMKGAKMGLN